MATGFDVNAIIDKLLEVRGARPGGEPVHSSFPLLITHPRRLCFI